MSIGATSKDKQLQANFEAVVELLRDSESEREKLKAEL